MEQVVEIDMRAYTNSEKNLVRGQLIQVRCAEEIVQTLDAEGKLDGVPFMPEMLPYCGGRFRIHRRADRTCVEGVGMRSMASTVFLDGVRCDGSQHDGCQRNCLIFWKEAWLTVVDDATPDAVSQSPEASAVVSRLRTRSGDKYYCQSTELVAAASGEATWKASQVCRELWEGELSIPMFLRLAARSVINKIRARVGLSALGILAGKQARNSKGDLGLKPGEWVEVKSLREIETTLDAKGKNCGLMFDPEMAIHAGKRFRVGYPIERIILEQNGRMAHLAKTVTLDGVVCQGLCAHNCPRANPIYWREIWLKRVSAPA